MTIKNYQIVLFFYIPVSSRIKWDFIPIFRLFLIIRLPNKRELKCDRNLILIYRDFFILSSQNLNTIARTLPSKTKQMRPMPCSFIHSILCTFPKSWGKIWYKNKGLSSFPFRSQRRLHLEVFLFSSLNFIQPFDTQVYFNWVFFTYVSVKEGEREGSLLIFGVIHRTTGC